ncbi:MAG: C40 family peptidase [Bacteroidales bacterium]|jgi:cell wall-associated NlpC family hydrolase|nr:C40 family peptidase [Bacteroidales bacterium]
MRIKYCYILFLSFFILGGCATKKQVQTDIVSNPNKKTEKINDALTDYCNEWLGSPYKFGGLSKKGVDCSGFVYSVYRDLYGVTLPRRSADMITAVSVVDSKDSLQRGDILFFHNGKGKINHVGIYLESNRFIHSSTSQGVIISTLNETYWQLHYHCGGHLSNKTK